MIIINKFYRYNFIILAQLFLSFYVSARTRLEFFFLIVYKKTSTQQHVYCVCCLTNNMSILLY